MSWTPKMNEMCEVNVGGRWARCVVKSIGHRVTVDYETKAGLKTMDVPPSSLREGTAPASKLDQLKKLMADGEWFKALALAAKFQDLGDHRAEITRAHNAAISPDFYRQIKQNPDALIAAGIEALKERYGR